MFLAGTLAIGGDSMADGMLTCADLASASLGDLSKPSLTGGALLRADAVVDFSTLGPEFGEILPKISTKILIDFVLGWSPSTGFQVSAPQVVLADITLDLGSVISSFAVPIRKQLQHVLSPLDWMIGPVA